jgi:hypothetical protein
MLTVDRYFSPPPIALANMFCLVAYSFTKHVSNLPIENILTQDSKLQNSSETSAEEGRSNGLHVWSSVSCWTQDSRQSSLGDSLYGFPSEAVMRYKQGFPRKVEDCSIESLLRRSALEATHKRVITQKFNSTHKIVNAEFAIANLVDPAKSATVIQPFACHECSVPFDSSLSEFTKPNGLLSDECAHVRWHAVRRRAHRLVSGECNPACFFSSKSRGMPVLDRRCCSHARSSSEMFGFCPKEIPTLMSI